MASRLDAIKHPPPGGRYARTVADGVITREEAAQLRHDIARVEGTLREVVRVMTASGYRPRAAARTLDQRGPLPWSHVGTSPFWAVQGHTQRAARRLGDIMALVQEAREDLQAAKTRLNRAGNVYRG